ncbi:hypothetical protein JD844_017083 [Phrynosoma platyrhinos]|uniref:Cadherin domain-containing protein n=1 Tax=Phrynosoma platyrhinos TaxID=52577 RepID=A0ABQ7SLA8_PHRPL|nr:hypothetical protein JD844_017083 [Phrynosoma platyrhinos]
MGSGQLHYSVPEESQHGTFVGRIAQDLGLQVEELMPRMFRMVSKDQQDYLEVNTQNGVLFISSRIDREELCAQSPLCTIHLEVILDKPLRVFHVEVEIKDVNDNAPIFSQGEEILSIPESVLPGAQFPLEGASDADVGANAQLKYKLSSTEYFAVEEKIKDRHSKSLVLLLKKPLDREQIPSVYRIKVLENAANGTLVVKLNATDLDEGTNGEISYSFSTHVAPNFQKIFSINSSTGEITVNGRIDFEDRSVYDLQVVAENKGNLPLSGHCQVIIEVLDVNDNAPEVSVSSLSVPVPEDSPLGTVVALISVSDKDSEANGQVTCSLWPPGLPFKLTSTFKNYYSLVVAELLDREREAEYRLMIMTQDQGVPSLSASSTVIVPISDINDNAPAFAQPSYTVFVKENNPPGAHIFTVSAFDPDIAENSLISYWIDEKLWPLSSYISVHSESGKIYALQPLDYEELKLLEFQVNAKDAGLPSLCGNVTIQVFVVDENDNAPTVTGQTEENSILLVVPVAAGHMLGKIRALDADSGYNAWVRYELHEVTSGPWRVGLYSGEISTIRSLDEAEGSRIHNLLVVVKDHGKPQLSATATLSVSLVTSAQAIKTDIRLPRTDESSKPLEDTVNVYLIIAICSVSSLFLLAIVVYVALRCHCPAKEAMVYGPGTATLVCASEVGSWSYSNRHSHILAGVSGEAGIKSDLMVFSPNIPASSENGKQQDLLCGTLVSTFKNYYSLVLNEPLDREKVAEYKLLVTAQDQGVPSLSASISLVVPIGDVNDNAPSFMNPSYTVFVKENNPPGAHIFTVSASDPDVAENALITYWLDEKLWPLSSYISVHSESGKLYALQSLDYEELKLLEFKVNAKDAGLPSLSSSVIVQIFVVDENDNAPAVSGLESTPILLVAPLVAGQIVAKIRALDADSGYNAWLHYELLEATGGPWQVGAYSGEITTTHALRDMEGDSSSQTVLVLVKDHGKPVLSATATLSVSLMANAQAMHTDGHHFRAGGSPQPVPTRTNVYLIIAICSVSSLFLLAVIVYVAMRCQCQPKEAMVYGPGTATLVCASEVGSWSYSNRHSHILAGVSGEAGAKNDLMVFSPNIPVFAENGEVRNGKEMAPDSSGQAPYTNDSEVSEQNLAIAESRLPGSRFLLAGASDLDISANALLIYKLSLNDYFILDSGSDEDHNKSPVLILKTPLDRENIPMHHLVLTATDGGKPKLTGTVQLVINVLDANDNPPVFNQSVYKINLVENAADGTLIIKVNATDLDEGTNGELSYFFSNNVPPQFTKIFEINSNTGELRVIGKVDFEDTNLYDLEIIAEDKGNLPLSGHCKVLIEVLDLNDNIPEVSVTSLSVPVSEDSPLGTAVALISVSDRDSEANGQVTCSLCPPDVPFKLESTFKNYYSLILAEPLDREQVPEYKLVVTVQDQGTPSLSASSNLLVPISDINDNVPTFMQSSYTVFVKENNPPGAHIFTVSASDPDVAENALISYWIDEKLWPLSSYISVNSESGKLYVLQPLDYEELKLLEFQVTAKDAGLPSLRGNVTIQVFVVDENDNAPVVSGPTEGNPILVAVPVVPGHMIAKVHAIDADSGYNAWLRYELLEGTTGPWRVGLYSGEITTTQVMDDVEDKSTQIILVVVKDHGKPQLSATGTLSVSFVANAQSIKTNAYLSNTGESSKPLEDTVNVYLIIAICSVSSLFLLAIVLYVAMRCPCQAKEALVYGPGTATLVCASEVGSWSYSNRHSHILAGVSGEAGAKNDLMVFSPNIPVFAENGEIRNGKELLPDSSREDLGLEVNELVPRMFRMVSKEQGEYFEVNVQNGILFVNSRIDREDLCASNVVCIIHLEVLVDKPLRVFHVEVEIADINDNAPIFPVSEKLFTIAESSIPHSRFPLEGASDMDIGTNCILNYQLSPNLHFKLEVVENYEHSASLFLVLNKPLDREEHATHRLLLIATDRGQPQLTGTVQLVIKVVDANDNPPQFNQSVYKVQLLENSGNGLLVIKLNATDLDEGTNKEIAYTLSSFSPSNGKEKFILDQKTGEVHVNGNLDFEDKNFYEMQVEAKDKGNPPLSGHCKVLIEILDLNDNLPEISVMSLLTPVPEDSPLGTVVALISISDKDTGVNGQVNSSLWPSQIPFKLLSSIKSYYSLVLAESLDREQVASYRLVVTAHDQGTPSLSATSILMVPVSDVNDNAPAFLQPSYTVFVKENNPPGAHIFTVSASDPDMAENSLISYWIDEKLWPLSSYISVHSESGKLYALQPLDYEELKLLEFQVGAKDAGLPSLCSNVTIQVFVVDENDNAPVVSGLEEIPIFLVVPVAAGYVVGKVHAVDADSGYNAWLRYELHEGTSGPWRVGLYSGEISTTYFLDDMEGTSNQRLLVVVKDHGTPQLSATATLSVSLVANAQSIKTDTRFSKAGENSKPLSDAVNVYLIIAICSVSSLFLLAIVLYAALRCHCQAKEQMVYGPGTATLVCASEVGSWSYSNRHSHILAGVNGEAGAKSDLMVFSPNIPASVDSGEVGIVKEPASNSSWLVDESWMLQLILFHRAWEMGRGQLHYSVPEESQHGTFVGRIAQDLGLEVDELMPRMFRMVSQGRGDYFEVNVQNGILFVNSRIDREELCTKVPVCMVHLEVILDKPLKVFHVEVEIKDINDNAPIFPAAEQILMISESRHPDSSFPLEGASDDDIGSNSHLTYRISANEYFTLDVQNNEKHGESLVLVLKKPLDRENYYSLVLSETLDREQVAEYQVVVMAQDQGDPLLSTSTSLVVPISDINDNSPTFMQASYTIFVKENNPPGAHIFTVSASDPDMAENALISYWIDETLWPLSSYISVHSESGKLYALQPLDYEELKLLEFQVRAKDAGMPSLCGNVTVQVFVVDENDNAPVVSGPEEGLAMLVVPITAGHVVGKIHALDADSGYNAWLRYELHEATNGPWRVGLYSGEISTTRILDEAEGSSSQNILVLVKDHGKPAQSVTATFSVSLIASAQGPHPDSHLPRLGVSPGTSVNNSNIYLIIAICSVSSLFLLAIVVYMALRCQCQQKEGVVYGPGTATLVCASEVGSWSYSNRHSHILATATGETGAKNDLMVFSPNIPVFAENGDLQNVKELVPNASGQLKTFASPN